MKPYISVDGYVYRFGVHASSSGNDLLTRVETYEGHTIYIDEPRAAGGLGRAPNPIEMFLSSLAGCFIVTLRLHSARFKIPITSVEALAEGTFDIRGFIMPQKFKSGFTSLYLKASVDSAASCDDLTKLLERVVSGWVVGSTISNALPIQLDLKIRCLDRDGAPQELSVKKLVKGVT